MLSPNFKLLLVHVLFCYIIFCSYKSIFLVQLSRFSLAWNTIDIFIYSLFKFLHKKIISMGRKFMFLD